MRTHFRSDSHKQVAANLLFKLIEKWESETAIEIMIDKIFVLLTFAILRTSE